MLVFINYGKLRSSYNAILRTMSEVHYCYSEKNCFSQN